MAPALKNIASLQNRASIVVRQVPRSLVLARSQVKAVTSTEAMAEAQDICQNGTAEECAAAWDKVERIVLEEQFQTKRRMKMMRKAAEDQFVAKAALEKQLNNDPLEKVCPWSEAIICTRF
ncbi:hypothetical protein CEUSTIGMA_g10012.t1 [Chlamydomonas eustigma]|uniref:Uncharacterized protein n=1 Tax=Chlamydomonas eustigma TaxID=1157962 RepID=A0A250XHW0_9CHLO|nr:hypothetical protein CEUSTIGMA_g10012.t1 [Chlamydomonas eustigma]|eukprot:GAX82586.1 hypothetical protein CEUSTIGMA_g10012.t1 [Chlamydomonas eustigma]